MILPVGHPLLPFVVIECDGRTYEDIIAVNCPPNTFIARVKVDVTHSTSPGGERQVADFAVVHPNIFQMTFAKAIPADVQAKVEAMLAKEHMAYQVRTA